jgi:DNA (cytosine-5)-methyltransferase 1
MFELPIQRHRWFSSNVFLWSPCKCRHVKGFYNVVGGKIRGYGSLASKTTYRDGKGRIRKREGYYKLAVGQAAMGINWMNRDELSQAIPPTYTQWIGLQLLASIKSSVGGVA